MRLPLWNIYRAFPELDKFSDDACRAYVREAKRAHWLGMIGMSLVGIIVFIVVAGIVSLLMSGVVAALPKSVSSAFEFMFLLVFAVPIFVGAVCSYMVRDAWVKKIVLERLKGAKCGRCTYTLLGLAVVNGGVVCPECGERLDLAARGLTHADLMSTSEPPEVPRS